MPNSERVARFAARQSKSAGETRRLHIDQAPSESSSACAAGISLPRPTRRDRVQAAFPDTGRAYRGGRASARSPPRSLPGAGGAHEDYGSRCARSRRRRETGSSLKRNNTEAGERKSVGYPFRRRNSTRASQRRGESQDAGPARGPTVSRVAPSAFCPVSWRA